jgi:hypothetical protein
MTLSREEVDYSFLIFTALNRNLQKQNLRLAYAIGQIIIKNQMPLPEAGAKKSKTNLDGRLARISNRINR